MKPYYGPIDGITIYHGDANEIAPSLEYDCVVSDPPYGISYNHDPEYQSKHAPSNRSQTTPVANDDKPFDPSPWIDRPAILWGANYYADKLPIMGGWLAFDKVTANDMNLRIGEMELAWTNCVQRTRVFRYLWSGAYRKEERHSFLHPTQKPVALMAWCIALVRPIPKVILDPFMGSGPTLEAAKRDGFRCIGIEIEERYCEIAAKRLQQGILFPAQ